VSAHVLLFTTAFLVTWKQEKEARQWSTWHTQEMKPVAKCEDGTSVF